jgi:nucleotide-binding universal stress UspA family protein
MALVEGEFANAGIAVAERDIPRGASAVRVKNVLFATDFSPISDAALPYATAICRRFGSTLHVAHVLSDTGLLMMSGGVDYVSMGTLYQDTETEAKEKIDQMAECFVGIPHRSHVRHGQVWKAIEPLIAANDVDLVVVGTHGRGGLGKLLLGSVAENILRHASCPVLTVGPKVSGRAKLPAFQRLGRDLAPIELELRQILVATNFARNATQLVQKAFGLAEEFHSRLTLMHVLEDYAELGSRPEAIEGAAQRLQELLPKDATLQYAPETLVDFGSTSDRILKVASEREADMIVLGARSSGDVGTTHLPWSSAHHVIAQAHCPVLTIRE